MARNKAIEERVKTLVAEILAEEEALGLNGDPRTINDIAGKIRGHSGFSCLLSGRVVMM
jgi:hypothetical protein